MFAQIVTQAARMSFNCAVGKAISSAGCRTPPLLALRSVAGSRVPADHMVDLVALAGEPLLLLEDLDRNSRPVVRGPSLVGIDDTQ